jgi:hypothetical protein
MSALVLDVEGEEMRRWCVVLVLDVEGEEIVCCCGFVGCSSISGAYCNCGEYPVF